ncbi:hypothetical protein NDN08_002780 [Rhodosorus marinus]|uniref:Uncharacterized protein n=1 Tax=Rhodosorus marinus TaxID=101924 RepID=A0AAV8UY70_9RHOD|nr:hypothetical protein NDN08_002780 [Rhodosorus marinus]
MHRFAAFVLMSMVVLKLTAGATTCDADPKKGLFGYEGACFALLDGDGVKHGEVCTSTVLRTKGMCLRAKFTVENTDSSLLKLRGGLHKKGDPVTRKWSRYTRKRTVASLNSPYLPNASLAFCPSQISVLEIPCCGSDLEFLGFAVISVPGPDSDSDRMQVKAYVSPQTTTAEDICRERKSGGGRDEFLCTLKLTCDSCPKSACSDSGMCVSLGNYACGDLEEVFTDPDTGACGCRCDPSKNDVGGIDPSDNSCQCEEVTCEENECFDPIQGCLSLESSAFCDALAPGSLLYKDDDGNCSCCPQGSCVSVGSNAGDSDAGGIKCITEADFGLDCMFSSAITDSEGLCQCCTAHPDHCFDTDQQRCVGVVERKVVCDAEAAADPFGRQFEPAKNAGACECCSGVGQNGNSCVDADQQCVSRQAFSSTNCNGLFPHTDASGNCGCCRTSVGEDQCITFGQCFDNDKFAAEFCSSGFAEPDENGFCHCVSRCPVDQCVDDSDTCVSVSSDSAKATCASSPKIPQHFVAVKNENTERCECCGADPSNCVNLDGGIDNATCVSTSAYSSTTCSSSEVVFTDGGQCGCCKVAGDSADSCFLPGETGSSRQCTKLADFKSPSCGNPYADVQQNYECRCCDSVDNCVTPNGECQPIASGSAVFLTCPGFSQGIVFLDEDEPGKCQCCGDHENTCINFRTNSCDTLDRYLSLRRALELARVSIVLKTIAWNQRPVHVKRACGVNT